MRYTGALSVFAVLGLIGGASCARGQGYGPPQPPPGAQNPMPPGGFAGPQQAAAVEPDVDPSYFRDELAPYGQWVNVPEYGECWMPNNVPPHWRPYTVGHWEYTDYGWTWMSNEPWGWATDHYGRWAWAPGFKWVWVPGGVWGPAWVAWRSGGGVVGWAPLPPERGFEFGVSVNFGWGDRLDANAFCFVPERDILDVDLGRRYYPFEQNRTIIRNTVNVTNVTVVNNRVVDRGIDVRQVERATGRRIEPRRLARAADVREAGVRGNEVRIYRPQPSRETERQRLEAWHERAGRSVDAGRTGRGTTAEERGRIDAQRRAVDERYQRSQELLRQREREPRQAGHVVPPERTGRDEGGRDGRGGDAGHGEGHGGGDAGHGAGHGGSDGGRDGGHGAGHGHEEHEGH